MRLTKEDIHKLVDTGRIDEMPAGAFVDGFEDFDGKYYPISAIDATCYKDRECEMYTHLTRAKGGVMCHLRFLYE